MVARRAGPAGSTASAAPTPRHQIDRIAGALPPIFPTVFPSSTSLFAITVSPATTEVWYPARHAQNFLVQALSEAPVWRSDGTGRRRSSARSLPRRWSPARRCRIATCCCAGLYCSTPAPARTQLPMKALPTLAETIMLFAHGLTSARLYHSETGIASPPRYPRGNPFGPSFARSAFVTSPLGPISTPCRRHYSASPGDFDVVAFDLCNSFIVAHSCPPKEKMTRSQPSGGIGNPVGGQR